MSHVTGDLLIEELKQVIRDAEELLKVTAGQAGEKVTEARAHAQESLLAAKARLAAVTGEMVSCAAEVAGRADARLRANPWAAIAVGAAAGLLAGLLLGRRGDGSR